MARQRLALLRGTVTAAESLQPKRLIARVIRFNDSPPQRIRHTRFKLLAPRANEGSGLKGSSCNC